MLYYFSFLIVSASVGSFSGVFGRNSVSGPTPKPSFGADLPTTLSGNSQTPRPRFGSADTPDGDAPSAWRKPPPIPRLPPPAGRKQSSVDDLETM